MLPKAGEQVRITGGLGKRIQRGLGSLGRFNGRRWHGDSAADGEHAGHACEGRGIMSNGRKLRRRRILMPLHNVGVGTYMPGHSRAAGDNESPRFPLVYYFLD